MKLNKLLHVLAATGLLIVSCQKEKTTPEESQDLLNNEAPFSDMVSKEVLEKCQTLASMQIM